MDKGTVILAILVNQFLEGFGLYEKPGTEEEQTVGLSGGLIASIVWFKNLRQKERNKEVLKVKGLLSNQ